MQPDTRRVFLTLLALGVGIPLARAEAAKEPAAAPPVRADRMFSDHMILQRGMPAPVWGTAAPGESVVVSIREQRKTTKAGADGKWMLKLDPLEAGEPATLIISTGDGDPATRARGWLSVTATSCRGSRSPVRTESGTGRKRPSKVVPLWCGTGASRHRHKCAMPTVRVRVTPTCSTETACRH